MKVSGVVIFGWISVVSWLIGIVSYAAYEHSSDPRNAIFVERVTNQSLYSKAYVSVNPATFFPALLIPPAVIIFICVSASKIKK